MADKRVVGIILKIGSELVGDFPYKKFLDKATCELSNIDIPPSNHLTCMYYDDDTGDIYFHFDRPVSKNILDIAFEERELIFEMDKDSNK